jgi:hypothetical protein
VQVLVTGYLVSLVLWGALCFASLKGALRLYRDEVIAEKWLLLVPFLFSSLLFYGIRYRFLVWVIDRDTLHRLFSIGAYWEADRIAFFACIPLFYVISILRPQWVVRVMVNVPLLVFVPFALKLALFASGLVPWDPLSARMMPTRVEVP